MGNMHREMIDVTHDAVEVTTSSTFPKTQSEGSSRHIDSILFTMHIAQPEEPPMKGILRLAGCISKVWFFLRAAQL